MSWQNDVAQEVVDFVIATWPECAETMRDSSAAKRNWREQLSLYEQDDATGISMPTAIISALSMSPNTSYGDGNDVYDWPFEIYYLTSWIAADGSAKTAADIDEELLDRAEVMRAGLYSAPATNFTVVQTPAIDSSLRTEVNQYLIAKNFQVKAIKVTMVALCGVASTA